MSGFSAEWLALREPADHRARNRDLLLALADAFAGRDQVSVVDLGCGTGSNLRACADHLPRLQHWRLVDSDPALLAAAREQLLRWSDHGVTDQGGLTLSRGDRTIAVTFLAADLAADLDEALAPSPDLVTAAALFDLVAEEWISGFASRVAATGAAFYTALTYDGREEWAPLHSADAAIAAAFHAHQRRDKGFGPASGPQATEVLDHAFTALGYETRTADSPWRLAESEKPLIDELAAGIAAAVRQTGRVEEADIASWLASRRAAATGLIGHTDLLALRRP
jgi:SAM-dependent methyltransferase